MKQSLAILILLCATFCTTATSAQTPAQQYRALWNEARETYSQAVGYRSENVPLTMENLSSNASDYLEGKHLEYLIDDDPGTFWHSDWHGEVQETHYLQIDIAQPLEGDIALYIKRRLTENNHVTLIGCHGSRDGSNWTFLGNIMPGNAYSGGETTSNAVSLNGEAYEHFRFYFLENTDGKMFAHFAEIRLLNVEVLGENMSMLLSPVMSALLNELERGRKTADQDITKEMTDDLKKAHDTLTMEMQRVKTGLLPSYMAQKTNIPTLIINTYDGSGIGSKEEYKYARMWRLESDSIAAYDSLRIRGRGNSTWSLAKKPYRIKFAQKEKFLGKGHANAKNWTLLANHSDKTLLRNAVASFIGRQMGQPFVPSAEFADVVLNGEYLGNYQISDQMEVHKKRVEIAEQDTVPGEEADISGGYLIEFSGSVWDEPEYFQTTLGQNVAIKSPDDDVITDRQREYIRNFVNDFETRLYSDDYKDSVKGYRHIIDSMTLASWFVANEYTANPDGYYSTYAYKNRGDNLLYWGPMWDYDIAFNNCHRLDMDMSEKLMLNEGYSSGKMKEYVQRMYTDEWFRNIAGRIWHKAAYRDCIVENTLAYVDSMARVIDQSQALNFQKWPLDTRVYDELVLFSTYQEGVDYLKKFLREHADFLSATLPNPEGLTPPLPAPENPLGVESDALYYIYNVNSRNVTDITEGASCAPCTWAADDARATTQLWNIVPATAQYYHLVLQGTNLAIADAAIRNGNSYVMGATLVLREMDETDEHMLWEFVPTAGYYTIVNRATGLAWNNSGGNKKNGTPIISWTNDEANASKPNRQWYIERASDDILNGIVSTGEASDLDYRVGYDPTRQEVLLHTPLGTDPRHCTLTIHDTNGMLLGKGDSVTPVSLSQHPAGIYVVSWNVYGHRRSIKFQKP